MVRVFIRIHTGFFPLNLHRLCKLHSTIETEKKDMFKMAVAMAQCPSLPKMLIYHLQGSRDPQCSLNKKCL